MHIDGTPITIEWYGYRDPLPELETQHCISAAATQALAHVLGGQGSTPLGQRPYSYSAGSVNLWLRIEPGETLIWVFGWNVLFYFPLYLRINEERGTQFIILREGPYETKVLAFGQLLAH